MLRVLSMIRVNRNEKKSKESIAMARGGTRPGAGRKKGKVGQAKREMAEMAKEHAETALLTLVEVASGDCAASARVSAATAILDRAYGMSLALGKKVQTDCSIRTQIDGMTYYFETEDSKAAFIKDPQGNLAKARAHQNSKS